MHVTDVNTNVQILFHSRNINTLSTHGIQMGPAVQRIFLVVRSEIEGYLYKYLEMWTHEAYVYDSIIYVWLPARLQADAVEARSPL